MRTTVNIDDGLLARARELALRRRRPLGEVIDDALRLLFAERTADSAPQPVVLPTFGGSGLRPGVDLDDREALATLLDESGDTRAAR